MKLMWKIHLGLSLANTVFLDHLYTPQQQKIHSCWEKTNAFKDYTFAMYYKLDQFCDTVTS